MKKLSCLLVLLLIVPCMYAKRTKTSMVKNMCAQEVHFIDTCMFKEETDMKIYDISWPLFEGMTTYKDKGTFKREETKKWNPDKSRESLITMGAHIGTHIDAPTHFLEKGKTIEQLDLTKLMGPCKVLDLTSCAVITAEDLKKHELASRVLLKTRNSQRSVSEKFDKDFVYVDKTAAKYLVDHHVVCVGIDYLGIETKQPDHETHQQLLENEIVIIEGLRLGDVEPGDYFLSCMPLALKGAEAAPARAVLIAQ